jgi:hypothetical protein
MKKCKLYFFASLYTLEWWKRNLMRKKNCGKITTICYVN